MPMTRLAQFLQFLHSNRYRCPARVSTFDQQKFDELGDQYPVFSQPSRGEEPFSFLRSAQTNSSGAAILPHDLSSPGASWSPTAGNGSAYSSQCLASSLFRKAHCRASASREAYRTTTQDLPSGRCLQRLSVMRTPSAFASMTQMAGLVTDSKAGSDSPAGSIALAAERSHSEGTPPAGTPILPLIPDPSISRHKPMYLICSMWHYQLPSRAHFSSTTISSSTQDSRPILQAVYGGVQWNADIFKSECFT